MYKALPKHIKAYVKQELEDYNKNCERFKRINGSTREMLILKKRLEAIASVYEELDDYDRKVWDLIYNQKIKQEDAVKYGISYDVYYYTARKIVWLTAQALELI